MSAAEVRSILDAEARRLLDEGFQRDPKAGGSLRLVGGGDVDALDRGGDQPAARSHRQPVPVRDAHGQRGAEAA